MTSSRRWPTTIAALLLAGSVLAIAPGTVSAQTAPTEVLHDDWAQVSAGGRHTCGIRTSGRLYCWGADNLGQLGNGGVNAQRLTPSQVVGGGTNWTVVTTGYGHSCALRSSGRLFCWGSDISGELGNGPAVIVNQNVPVEVSDGTTDWVSVSAGAEHTCARKRSGRLFCWGSDTTGQLGDGGVNVDANVPIEVAGHARNWASVSVGRGHTCARRTNGRLFCWGLDDHGQLGNGGTAANRTLPGRVGTAMDWVSVTAGWRHTCGRRGSGRVFCWGADDSGQIGDGGPGVDDQSLPVEVLTGGANWVSVTAGDLSTCGRRRSGRLYCWGSDASGQLGDGSPNSMQTIPAEVFGGRTNWTAVDAGGSHTCALWRSGRVLCWGKDEQGQLGDGSPYTNQPAPVAVH